MRSIFVELIIGVSRTFLKTQKVVSCFCLGQRQPEAKEGFPQLGLACHNASNVVFCAQALLQAMREEQLDSLKRIADGVQQVGQDEQEPLYLFLVLTAVPSFAG